MRNNQVASELAAIKDRLAALASDPNEPATGQEIGAIQAQLRALAQDNAAVAERLGRILGVPDG